ncbi:Retrotransposon gag protein [Gossypium australe]|uniref:Retrotransposon gag protein n=1 Tax=Gossypium australe TaxID=47621 RepID=A0A5B6U5F4_9ROSI|nr:Retrotransposon gag protein [Gossypium australe]
MLIQKCPHHEFPKWMRLLVSYNGLDANARYGLDRAVQGALMNRMYENACKIIENMTLNSCQWLIEHFTYGQKSAMVKAIQQDDKYQLNGIEFASTPSMHGGDKPLFHYINNPIEDINDIRNKGGNPYSNAYNPSWRDHPNLRWGGNQGASNNSNQAKKTNYHPPYL